MSRITKRCRFCNAEYSIPRCKDKAKPYCSSACGKAHRSTLRAELQRTCETCGKLYSIRRTQVLTSKWCSHTCMGVAKRGIPHSPEWVARAVATRKKRYRPKYGPARAGFRGGRAVGADGYVRVLVGPMKYELEHRIAMAGHLGRALESWEIVHHINGDKADNCVENLAVVSRAEHMREHIARGDIPIDTVIPKLSPDAVRAIRADGRRQWEIARQHGVHQVTVSDVKLGRLHARVV